MIKRNRLFYVVLVVAMASGIFIGCGESKNIATDTSSVQYSEFADNNINIPGYESIDFKAGKKKQSSKFHNPENNSCYFVMTLIMDDETLWKSDYIKPGESINKMKLSRSLEAGEYSAKLKYECFTLNDKNPLNGADITLMINVS